MSVINSHDNWSPLEEVWLGDVYPVAWYDHLSSEVRDCFYELTERTHEDLKQIQLKLESLGVVVRRPYYDHIDNYIIAHTQQLDKPEICPRDYYVTIGQTLHAKKAWKNKANPWQHHIDAYEAQGAVVVDQLQKNQPKLNGANTVKAGKDLYFDLCFNQNDLDHALSPEQKKDFLLQAFQTHYAEKFKDYRVHVLFNGGHIDACFSLLAPGVILGNRYFKEYDKTFPGWQLINVTDPEFAHRSQFSNPNLPGHNGMWWLPDFYQSQAFNRHIVEHAKTWIGDYTETFFEVNCLVIDQHNVVIPGQNEQVFKHLEKLGITAHPVPFRTRTFWDGGMHCITLDIRRRGSCQDLFPERGDAKITVYD